MLIAQGMYQEHVPVIAPRSYQEAWYGCSVATYPITREYLPGPEDESGRKQIPNQQATIMEHHYFTSENDRNLFPSEVWLDRYSFFNKLFDKFVMTSWENWGIGSTRIFGTSTASRIPGQSLHYRSGRIILLHNYHSSIIIIVHEGLKQYDLLGTMICNLNIHPAHDPCTKYAAQLSRRGFYLYAAEDSFPFYMYTTNSVQSLLPGIYSAWTSFNM